MNTKRTLFSSLVATQLSRLKERELFSTEYLCVSISSALQFSKLSVFSLSLSLSLSLSQISSGVQIESSDHSPSEEDLRSICVMVSHQMKEQASAFRDVIHNGWPNIKTKGKTRKRKHEENPSEVLFGEQQASTSGKKKQTVTTFHMSGTPTPIYNFDRHDVESATDSETVREDLSSDEEEGTRGDSGIARQKNLQVVEEEGEDSVYSTPVLGVMDSLELLALMKGKPLKGEEGKKTRSEIKKIAASLLPRILLKLFIEMVGYLFGKGQTNAVCCLPCARATLEDLSDDTADSLSVFSFMFTLLFPFL